VNATAAGGCLKMGSLVNRSRLVIQAQKAECNSAKPARQRSGVDYTRNLVPKHMATLRWGHQASPLVIAAGEAGHGAAPASDVYVLPIAGDGRCMFRALAQGEQLASRAESGHDLVLLASDAETARADELRQGVCEQLRQRKQEVAPFIPTSSEQSFEAYVDAMRGIYTWGGTTVRVHAPMRSVQIPTNFTICCR
jgi:hypothetical protein